MTLSVRNNLFKIAIFLILFCIIMAIISTARVFPVYSELAGEEIRRPGGLFQFFTSRLFGSSFYAVHVSLILAVLYSCISIILIYYYFSKTQAPEILYVAFFSFSISLDAARFIIPLNFIYEIPPFYQLIAAKILLFGRYFGIFSLFTAGIYASGLNLQKNRALIVSILIATLIIALGASIDIQNWDTGFYTISGYDSLFRFIEITVFLLTVISFFIAAYTSEIKEYFNTGIGAFLALTGRNILLLSDSWAGPIPGIVLLSLGTWMICTSLHKIYLWR